MKVYAAGCTKTPVNGPLKKKGFVSTCREKRALLSVSLGIYFDAVAAHLLKSVRLFRSTRPLGVMEMSWLNCSAFVKKLFPSWYQSPRVGEASLSYLEVWLDLQ